MAKPEQYSLSLDEAEEDEEKTLIDPATGKKVHVRKDEDYVPGEEERDVDGSFRPAGRGYSQ